MQTTLQELYRLLDAHGIPAEFVRCAAPTGTAAFNLRFNATTIHRLIHWTNLRHFGDITNDVVLQRLQQHLQHTTLIFLDEVSMIGRRMMGRIDARFKQGKPASHEDRDLLGNLSCVAIGDPAQCEAMADEQFYDPHPRSDSGDACNPAAARLSNAGLSVYNTFDEVVLLTNVHRQSRFVTPTTPQEHAYNERSNTFWDIAGRLRDYNITMDDYFWLCKRKHAKLPLGERTFFSDAPILMEFRRTTDDNPEDNCDFYNQQKLSSFAKGTQDTSYRLRSIPRKHLTL